jgi:hypothetical protein
MKFRDVKDGDVAYLGDWMARKGGALNLIGEPNFCSRRLEWRDAQGAICKYDGREVLEEKERALEEMGHAKGPDFTKLVNQRYSFVCVSPLQPQQYHVDDNQRRCLSHGANVRKDLEVALDNYCATTSHPAARAAAGGTAREQKLLQLHDDQVFLNATLQTGLLQLKKAPEGTGEGGPCVRGGGAGGIKGRAAGGGGTATRHGNHRHET